MQMFNGSILIKTNGEIIQWRVYTTSVGLKKTWNLFFVLFLLFPKIRALYKFFTVRMCNCFFPDTFLSL